MFFNMSESSTSASASGNYIVLYRRLLDTPRDFVGFQQSIIAEYEGFHLTKATCRNMNGATEVKWVRCVPSMRIS